MVAPIRNRNTQAALTFLCCCREIFWEGGFVCVISKSIQKRRLRKLSRLKRAGARQGHIRGITEKKGCRHRSNTGDLRYEQQKEADWDSRESEKDNNPIPKSSWLLAGYKMGQQEGAI